MRKLLWHMMTIAIIVSFFSCTKNENHQPVPSTIISISTRPLSTSNLVLLGESLKKHKPDRLSRFASFNEGTGNNEEVDTLDLSGSLHLFSDSLETQLAPLIQNGKAIHAEMLQQIQNSPEWQLLTEEEKLEITDFEDGNYAQLALSLNDGQGLVLPTLDAGVQTIDPALAQQFKPVDAIRSCVAVALGISSIQALITNTTSLMTAQSAIQILKIVGKRYLSYIGVAWMIWDFTSCISNF